MEADILAGIQCRIRVGIPVRIQDNGRLMAVCRAPLDGRSHTGAAERQEVPRRQARMQGLIPGTEAEPLRVGKDMWDARAAVTEFRVTAHRRRATGARRRPIARPRKATGEVKWATDPRTLTRVHMADSDTVRLAGTRVRLAAVTPQATVAVIRFSRMAAGMRRALAVDTPEDSAGGATRPVASGGATVAVAGTLQAADTRVAVGDPTEGIEGITPESDFVRLFAVLIPAIDAEGLAGSCGNLRAGTEGLLEVAGFAVVITEGAVKDITGA